MAVTFADTNIVIEYLKGNLAITEKIKKFETIYINDVVIMELFQGARNKKELDFIKKNIMGFDVLTMNHEIVSLARGILDRYTLSHNMKIMDALIAATVMRYDIPLFTLNTKDFRYLEQVDLTDVV
jgi:predicted nucleic acid-binding protein